MIQAQGYAAQQAKSPLHQYSFERRDPRNHDVVVDIQYCGICHTDVHQVNDEWGDSIFPMVPGHEIVGIVTKVGANVSRYKLGDRVGVGCLVDSCRKCNPCKNGLEQYCIEGPTMTYNGIERDGRTRTQGGYSNKIVVDENYVLHIPDNLPMDCASTTSLRRYYHVFSSSTLECRSWEESWHNRSGWIRSHGSQDRTCAGRRSQCANSLYKKTR